MKQCYVYYTEDSEYGYSKLVVTQLIDNEDYVFNFMKSLQEKGMHNIQVRMCQ